MKDKRNLIFINVCYLLALLLVILPLLMVSKYNMPSADDWSYGREAYKAIRSGAGIGTVLRISVQMAAKSYSTWEGRFMNSFLASLQPGIWGEGYYGIVAWIMLGGLIASELFLSRILLRGTDKRGRLLWFSVMAPSLILQILYTPSVVESFYWYTGAVNYTFVFSLSLILVGLFIELGYGELKGWRYGLAAVVAGVLAVMVGGDNYSTSLSTILFMVLFYLCARPFKQMFVRTWYLLLLEGGSFLLCLLAPGNSARLAGNFGGTTRGAGWAVWMSLVRSATNIYSWTNIKIILMLLLILPFAWQAVQSTEFDFRWPALFTLLSFGLYASQIAPTMYVDGTTGGGRMAAILYYSYHIWLVGNLCYWGGWLCKRRQKMPAFVAKFFSVTAPFVRKYLIPYCAVIGIVLAGVIYRFDLKEISSYRAYRDWRQGWAQQYALEWQERLKVLHDESVKQVEFAPLSVYPETILYTDLQDENGYIWVNKDCAAYYDKEYIHIVPQ